MAPDRARQERSRTIRRQGAVLVGVLLLIAGVASRAALAGDFYDIRVDPSAYAVGDVIAWEPVDRLTAQLSHVAAVRMMYRSDDSRGAPIAVTGLVLAPVKASPPAGGWPIVSFAHGTTGVGDACAPSKYPDLYWDLYAWFVGRLVLDGFVVVATDYEGLGTPGLHPWLELDSEAHAVIDGVTAARRLVPEAGARWAAVGHSQGGHAALGAGELALSRQGPGLTYVGGVAAAPASHLLTLAPLADAPDRGWDLLAYVAASIRAGDPAFDYADFLVEPLLGEMPRAEETCTVELFQYFARTYASDLTALRSDWQDQAPVLAWFTRNEPGQRPSGGPLLLLQGTNDEFVPAFVTTDLAARLCAHGEPVTYHLFAGLNHDIVLRRAYNLIVAWLRERFAGEVASSTCP